MSDFLSTPGAARAASRRAYLVLGTSILALGLWLFAVGVAHADDRFGPPWQSRVTADQTTVYSQPDRSSQPVGPLGKGAIVVVLGNGLGANGDWTQIVDGFVLSADLTELTDEWVGEVTADSVNVYARPDPRSGIRRTAKKGDLLRVTGVSAGLDGNTNIWWATTEGYVGIQTIKYATSDWARGWALPEAGEAVNGWWGAVKSEAYVRAGPTTAAPIVGTFAGGERVKVLSVEQGEAVNGSSIWYRIDGGRYAGGRVHSSLIARIAPPRANTATPPDRVSSYIVVDRATSSLTFVQDGKPVFVTYVSLGLAGVATPTGVYSTLGKFRSDRMTSRSVPNATHSYDLPNVPFTQYYRDGGYGIHGTYWHDLFGTRESQGCINLTWTDSAYLFLLTQPFVWAGLDDRWQDASDPATPVVILD